MSNWFIKLASVSEEEKIVQQHIDDDQPFYSSVDYLFEKIDNQKLLEDYLELCISHVCDVDEVLLDKIKNKDLLKQYVKLALIEDLTLPKDTIRLIKDDKELLDIFIDKYPDLWDIYSRGDRNV